MKIFNTFYLVLLSFFTMHAQVPEPSSFLWRSDVNLNITIQQSYDMHANEVGINIAYDESGLLK